MGRDLKFKLRHDRSLRLQNGSSELFLPSVTRTVILKFHRVQAGEALSSERGTIAVVQKCRSFVANEK
jgi:hypothetical protein